MKFQFAELLILTLNESSRYQFLVVVLEEKTSLALSITYFSFLPSIASQGLLYIMFFSVRRILKVCITLLLLKTSWAIRQLRKKVKVWISFFLLDIFLHDWFFINLQMSTKWKFVLLNTVIIIFCLIYFILIKTHINIWYSSY